ncbi:MAG TPA: AtpZ/AtpI family protein [Bauldia sp.]|nr:AtpZ/AtpI family protein [Bauldia sp.]
MSDRDSDPADPASRRSADDGALSDRLRDLERRLDESHVARQSSAPRPEPQKSRQGYALAMRLGADFVAGVVVGAAIGWGVDRLFGTSPWGLIVFLLLGFAAGILSVLRTAGLVKPGPPGPDDRLGGKR